MTPPRSHSISIIIHALVFAGLMYTPKIELPEPGKSAYKQAIEGHETKLVWYRFKQDLPDVAPPTAKADPKPLRAKVRAKQQIVASPKKAPPRPQMVWAPAPELPDARPLESPNILAVRLPPIAPPVRAEFDAPTIESQPLTPVPLPPTPKFVKSFTPPPATLPPTKVPLKLAEVAPLGEAPQIALNPLTQAALDYSFKAPARPFTAPAQTARSGAAGKQISLEAPPVLEANSRDLNLAVVGLNPLEKAISLPTSSSPGQFSAGPKVRPEGSDSSGDAKGLSVPDLFVRGARDAKPDLIAQAYAAPTASSNLREALRGAGPARTGAELPLPASSAKAAAVRVSSAPDPRFNNRDVYMMAVQMPNLTSYSGSWLMWYSDHQLHEAGLAPISPPVPHRKVDPKYIAAAVAEKVEGKVQLLCVVGMDGHVSAVEVVRGLDDRLNQSAVEALTKWEFTPATRQGAPLAVDVLVEIPFRLEHLEPVRF